MVFLVLEAHGPLHFGSRVDERTQRIAGQRVIVSAGVDVLELAGFVIAALGIGPFEQEAFDFVGGVESVALLFMEFGCEFLQDAANVSAVRLSTFVYYIAEDQDFAGTEDIGWRPVERCPVNAKPQVAFALGGESADGRAVEGEVVPALEQKFLVVVEHVQTAFKVAEDNGHGFDPLLVRQVLETIFPNLVSSYAVLALLFGFQVQLLEFVIRERKKIPQF